MGGRIPGASKAGPDRGAKEESSSPRTAERGAKGHRLVNVCVLRMGKRDKEGCASIRNEGRRKIHARIQKFIEIKW